MLLTRWLMLRRTARPSASASTSTRQCTPIQSADLRRLVRQRGAQPADRLHARSLGRQFDVALQLAGRRSQHRQRLLFPEYRRRQRRRTPRQLPADPFIGAARNGGAEPLAHDSDDRLCASRRRGKRTGVFPAPSTARSWNECDEPGSATYCQDDAGNGNAILPCNTTGYCVAMPVAIPPAISSATILPTRRLRAMPD